MHHKKEMLLGMWKLLFIPNMNSIQKIGHMSPIITYFNKLAMLHMWVWQNDNIPQYICLRYVKKN